MTPEKLLQNYAAAKTARTNVETQWRDVETYVMPYRGQFYTDNTGEGSVVWEHAQIYDSTAMVAAQTLASAISFLLTPQGIQLFTYKFKNNPELNKDPEAAKWLDAVTRACWAALDDSGLGEEKDQSFLDLTGYGSAVIIEEEELDEEGVYEGINFVSTPLKDCFIDESHKRDVLRFYRRLMWTPLQMVDKFGEKVPEHIQEKAENSEAANQRLEVVYCIYPEKANAKADTGKPLAPGARPFQFKYLLVSSGEELGEGGGYYEMPAFLMRYARSNDSVWGNSPAMLAMPDIKTLNRQEELMLSALEKVIDPPSGTTERGLIGDLDLSAGAVNVFRSLEDYKELVSQARFDVAIAEREAKRESVRRIFHEDKLRLKESPAMTAAEVHVRYQLMQQHLSSVMNLLMSSLLKPLAERTFNIVYRAGQIPVPPEVVKQADASLELAYQGPLARNQNQTTVNNIQQWVGGLVALSAQLGNQELLDPVNLDEIPRTTGNLLSVPAELLKSEEQVAAERAKRQAAMEEQMKLQQAQGAGDAMQSLGEGLGKMQEAGGMRGAPGAPPAQQ